ncbi:ASCH domain-containing protein [Dongia sp.]|uniref:ASCH domain-containing protein n=1 Tax=Dongia sp. TaxID=1977262 RepID=UPI0035AEB39B
MKALSVRQPWAWAIMHAGKTIENRDWGPHYPALREAREMVKRPGGTRVALHASSIMPRKEYVSFLCFAGGSDTDLVPALLPRGLPVPAYEDLPRGGIIGEVDLVSIVDDHDSPWFFGPLGLVLANPTPLPFRPCRGALGFFEVPAA